MALQSSISVSANKDQNTRQAGACPDEMKRWQGKKGQGREKYGVEREDDLPFVL
jgi:hypothetical protein